MCATEPNIRGLRGHSSMPHYNELQAADPNLFDADLDSDPDFAPASEAYGEAPFDPNTTDPGTEGLASSGSGARTVSEPTTSANPADATDAEDADGPTDFYNDALDYLLTNHNRAMDHVDEFES